MTLLSPATAYLPGRRARADLMRLESAAILKRFFFCEEALLRGAAGWLPAIAPLELKLTLPRHIWQAAQNAESLRARVLELRYPNRLIEVGDDAPLVTLFEAARHAPDAAAYLAGLVRVLIPALGRAYRAYLAVADDLGDGPTKRFLDLAAREKEAQAAELEPLLSALLAASDPATRARADGWAGALVQRMAVLDGVSLAGPAAGPSDPLPGSVPFTLVQAPSRDSHFHLCRFYWPDIVDPTYPYGDGVALQLRSAISHLNEVWAVEAAGAVLEACGPTLGWEFVADAARWVYDESRHALMGWTRLRDWGFDPQELPLGSYIYDSARGQDPLYRLAMLFYFETKNIGKKPKRAEAFASYGDAASQHDMEFDWADESTHAGYGKRWLSALIAAQGLPPEQFEAVRQRCEGLVATVVASASPAEVADTRAVATALIARATALARG